MRFTYRLPNQLIEAMKKKSPPIVKEYATFKEQYLAEIGTLEGYENLMAKIERRLREVAAKRTRPDGTVEPLPEIEPVAVEEVVEYETVEERYLAEKGTMDGFEEMIVSMERQMREYAAKGWRIIMKGDRVLRIERPQPAAKKKSQKK